MKTKATQSLILAIDITTFLATGGYITYCKPSKNKKQYSVTGKQKQYYKAAQPTNRPSTMFDAFI